MVCWLLPVCTYAWTINVEPGTTVETGQEVFFESVSSQDPGMVQFTWRFGDGTADIRPAIAVTHAFRFPGTYLVSLAAGSTLVDSVVITVEGSAPRCGPRAVDPILVLKFEDNLADSSGNQHNASWVSGSGNFADGAEGQCLDLGGDTYVSIPDFTYLNNKQAFTVSCWIKSKTSTIQPDRPYVGAPLLVLGNVFNLSLETESAYGSVTTAGGTGKAGGWFPEGYPAGKVNHQGWHHYALVYDGSYIRLYIDGIEIERPGGHCPVAFTGQTLTGSGPLYLGTDTGSGSGLNAYLDEVRIYDRALSQQELHGFELWHADFASRIRQYVYAQVPGEVAADATNRLKVTLSLEGGGTHTLADNNDLQEEEVFLIDHQNQTLAAGTYTLLAQLTTASGTVLDQITERYTKAMSGAPVVGIDENNSIRVNNELFFPVTPFGLNDANVAGWVAQDYINMGYGKGFWPENFTLTGWQDYLDISAANGIRSMGPTMYEDTRTGWWCNYDVAGLKEYVNATKNHAGLGMWSWGDEPDLGGPNHVPGSLVRSQTYHSHQLDPLHPVATNYCGNKHIGPNYNYEVRVEQEIWHTYNHVWSGMPMLVADIYGFDYYPLDWAAPCPQNATMDQLVKIIKRMRTETRNLVPIMSFVETADIDIWAQPPYTPWAPTAGQVKMMTWINVVHGIKGINWFHYFSSSAPGVAQVMTEFTQQITRLAPAVLGPEVDLGTAITAPDSTRIDFMERVYQDTLYIFAVRVAETNTSGQSIGQAETATINLPSGLMAGSAVVFDEGRSLPITGQAFTDTFNVNSVHVYKIPASDLSISDRLPRLRPQQVIEYENPCTQALRIRHLKPGTRVTLYDLNGYPVTTAIAKDNRPIVINSPAAGTTVYLLEIEGVARVEKVIFIK
jgi:hypothetical protein